MDAMMKRGGKARKTMKQKQSVVIKNVINIGEKKRMRPRQRRARKQPQDGRQATGGGGIVGAGAFNPIGVQFPYQKLFQPPPNEYRSLTMSSANANEASINVSKVADDVQSIVYGKLKNDLNDALTFQAFRRLQESQNVRPSPSGVRVDEVDEVDEDAVNFDREIIRSNDEYQKLVDEKRKLENEMKDVIVEDVGEDKQDFFSPLQQEQERILGKAQENIAKKRQRRTKTEMVESGMMAEADTYVSKKDIERMRREEEATLKELQRAYEETPLSARKKLRKKEYNINE